MLGCMSRPEPLPPSAPRRALLRANLLRDGLLHNERGATAVEFALVALPFSLLLFMIMELALVFLVSTGIESAAERAARTIRTGEFQGTGAVTRDAFKT